MMQGRRSSRIMTPLGLAVCLSLFGDLTLYTVLVTQLDEVGLSLSAVGVMLGVNRLVRIPGNLLTGVFVDRWGRQRLFVFGMLLGVLSTASYGLTRGFWPFLAGRLAWGIAWTCINVGGMAMVLDVSSKVNRGRLSGLYNTWLGAGFAFGPLVGGFLVDTIGFRPAMLICAGLTAIGLVVAVVALPETSRLTEKNTQRKPRPPSSLQGRLGSISPQRIRGFLGNNRNLVTVSLLLLITQFAGEGIALSCVSCVAQTYE